MKPGSTLTPIVLSLALKIRFCLSCSRDLRLSIAAASLVSTCTSNLYISALCTQLAPDLIAAWFTHNVVMATTSCACSVTWCEPRLLYTMYVNSETCRSSIELRACFGDSKFYFWATHAAYRRHMLSRLCGFSGRTKKAQL